MAARSTCRPARPTCGSPVDEGDIDAGEGDRPWFRDHAVEAGSRAAAGEVERAVGAARVGQARAGGVGEFHVWTVDSPDDARFFRDLGAVDITTNRPTLLREALGEEQR